MTNTSNPSSTETQRPLALLSVHDKTGLAAFGRALVELGYDLLASGGTARALLQADLRPMLVEDLTGFPELLGGRVKTLHPAVHAGILSRRTPSDEAELGVYGLRRIDLVAVSLYPFEEALARGVSAEKQLEEIDIGGVALLRAASKSFEHVTVVPGPEHYAEVLEVLQKKEALGPLRRKLAALTFQKTAAYDHAIASWLLGAAATAEAGQVALRYGENPHQSGAFACAEGPPWTQHGGKELSYNNLLDLDAAWSCVAELPRDRPGAVVVKHGSPCGVAVADTLAGAVRLAIAADPVSAFGGIVAVNRPLDYASVEALGDLFLEVVACPPHDPKSVVAQRDLLAAVHALKTSKKNCRILTMALDVGVDARPRARTVLGGTLTQAPDLALPEPAVWQTPTARAPSEAETEALAFAFLVAKHVKSNAIVLASHEGKALVTRGIGGGQTNRIDAVHQAIQRAGEHVAGAVLASDAFFPFSDGVEAAAAAGIAAVVQPGGALRDAEVVAAADRLGVAMCLTGRRHFRH